MFPFRRSGRLTHAEPLDEATLAQLYPSPQDYVAAVRKATRQAVRRGFVLAEDAPAIIGSAKQRSAGW